VVLTFSKLYDTIITNWGKLKTQAYCKESKQTKTCSMKTKLLALETKTNAKRRGGTNLKKESNLFVKDGEIFAFVTKRGDFLRYSTREEWENAVTNWDKPLFQKEFPYDIFPSIKRIWINDTEGIEYRSYQIGHPKFGKIERFHFEENEDRPGTYWTSPKLSLMDLINLKAEVEIFQPRSEYQIEAGKKYWQNVLEAFEKIKSYSEPGDYHVDQFGVDNLGNICIYHCVCEKEDCDCAGGWWEGFENDDDVRYFSVKR
jgi:hypothetical protein